MESLAAYIPMDRRQALAREEDLPDRTSGAVLFADISGFTPLTETLVQELGPKRGAEELTHQLNRVYGALIAEVHRYGGSVIGFSGDAITCWFNGDRGRCATACGLALQTVMTQLETLSTPGDTSISLGIKVAVTAGPARRFLVGDPRIHTIEVLAGGILDRVAAAEKQLREGEVIVGAEVVAWFGDQAQIQEWRADPRGEHFAVVTGLTDPVPPPSWPDVPGPSPDIARAWLLPPVYQRLQRGEGEFLAELRPVVPLFLRFGGINYDQDDEAGAKLDNYVRWVQSVLARYEGYLLQLTIGDKGSYLYAVFGAPLAHEDDPARAVAAALDLSSLPTELDFIRGMQIGISQGQARAGGCGGPARRTYGVLGSEVNIAARLMSQAEPGQILVTARIRQATAGSYDFEALEPVQLKGRTAPMQIFLVRGGRLGRSMGNLFEGRFPNPMIGRTAERTILAEHLRALLDGRGSNIIIEGGAGIGKSRLVADLLGQAHTLAIPRLVGAGDAIEQATSYYAWRPIFRQIFGLDEMSDLDAARRRVLAQLEDSPQLLERAPLINAVLPLNLPDNDLTAQMTGEVRANNTRDLLVNLLERTQRAVSVLLLILEDAHWLDSASWALTLAASQRVHPLMLVIATRPMTDPIQDEYQQLLGTPGAHHLELETLPQDDILALVAQSLGVAELPPEVGELIHEKAEGHPFFSEELAYAMRETGLITITDGECRIAPDAHDLSSLNLPDTVQGVIASRIDQLRPSQQLTLKVASVIGRVFGLHILNEIYPVKADKPFLREHLSKLEELGITRLETTEPDLTYIFKHIITQEVAYNTLLFTQRQQLHRAAAEWYERFYAADMSSVYPLLAHHWSEANVTSKAIDSLDKAGEVALRNFANEEAVAFFDQALSLHAESKAASDNLRRGLWELKLGEAYVNLPQYEKGRVHLEAGLALLSRPVPGNLVSQVSNLLGEILKQVLHRLWPARYVGRLSNQRDVLLAASRAYGKLTEVYYLANEIAPALYAAFRALNQAEAAGPSPELARSYATVGTMIGFIPLHGAAEAYLQRALNITQNIDDLPARAYTAFVSGFYHAGVGNWARTRDLFDQAAEIFDHLGDRTLRHATLSNMIPVSYFQGEFALGVKLSADLSDSADQRSDPLYHSAGLQGKADGLLYLGNLDEATTCLESLQALLARDAKNADESIKMSTSGILAALHLRHSEYQQALDVAEQTVDLTGKTSPSNYSAFPAYAYPAEVYLALWESGYPQPKLDQLAQKACKVLRGYARVFPVGRPRALLWQGLYQSLAGKPASARKLWQKSLATAQELGMPYDEGLAHYEIGRHLPADDPGRADHLSRAIETFAQLEAAYDLKRAQAALSGQNASDVPERPGTLPQATNGE